MKMKFDVIGDALIVHNPNTNTPISLLVKDIKDIKFRHKNDTDKKNPIPSATIISYGNNHKATLSNEIDGYSSEDHKDFISRLKVVASEKNNYIKNL